MINDGSRAACEVSSVKKKTLLKNDSSAGLQCALGQGQPGHVVGTVSGPP